MPIRRVKYAIILGVVAAGALALLAATQTWYTVHLAASANHPGGLDVPGSSAAPALTALSLACLALALALAISGRIARFVLALLGVLVGVCIILSAAGAMANPEATGISIVTKATGIAGDDSVRRLIVGIDATLWPPVALAAGILVALAGVAAWVTANRWAGGSKRYQAVRFSPAERAPDSEAQHPATNRPAAENARDAAIDTWDDLSNGDDPTR
jgi:uncharacterized membrane protein (TIGR02234 family)